MSPVGPVESPTSRTAGDTQRNIESAEHYAELQQAGLTDPDVFWRATAKQLHFETALPDAGDLLKFNFNPDNGAPFVRFAEGAKTNICYNCIDRFMLDRDGPEVEGVRVPKRNFIYKFYWEGNYWDEPTHDYAELTWETFQIVVNKCANVLKSKGVQKGDRVLLYLPMVFQLPVAMLACTRIGAVHVNVRFKPGGMSAEGLAERIALSGAELIVTVDGFWRGTKLIKAKEIVDRAVALCKERGHQVKLTLVISHLSPNPGTPPPELHEQFVGRRPCYFLNAPFTPEQDEWWADNFCKASPVCDVEWMDAEDPLFISFHQDGEEDKLQATVYTVGGYMLQAYSTFKHLFDYRQGDDEHDDINENICFCLHDYSTITGITYGVYGPLLNGATVLQFEGIGSHPDPGRIWAIIQNYQVEKVLLTSSEVRLAMGSDPSYVSHWNKASLRLIAVAGEPLSAPERQFLMAEIGANQIPLIEVAVPPLAGGAVASGFPGIFSSTVVPYFGVDLALVDKLGKEITGSGTGFLCARKPLPGMVRSYIDDNTEEKYGKLFKRIPGKFFIEFVAARKSNGEYVILGKESDILLIDNEFVSPGAVETALMGHPAITDAAVVCADGNFQAFVTVDWGYKLNKEMANDLRKIAINLLNGAYLEVRSMDVIPRNFNGVISRAALRRIAGRKSEADTEDFDGSLYDLVDEAIVACEKILNTLNALF